jgi:DNA (cytosine-5)-methyltransferase 1
VNVGSLFAGIGGFDLGFERAGMRTIWQVELDPYCRAVLARHFPHAARFEDVREVGGGILDPVDLICGGFPCQDLSLAGRGAGIDGERSGLWAEFARIVGELRPRYVVVENVPALTRNEWLGRVLGDLAACGYDAEWDCISASALGAPHRRDRFWLIAYPRSGGPQGSGYAEPGRRAVPGGPGGAGPLADPEGVAERAGLREGRPGAERGRRPRHGGSEGGVLADAQRAGGDRLPEREQPGHLATNPRRGGEDGARGSAAADHGRRASGHEQGRSQGVRRAAEEWWAVEPDVGRVADGVPSRVDRLSALGNALVPQIAEWIGQRILDYEQERAGMNATKGEQHG